MSKLGAERDSTMIEIDNVNSYTTLGKIKYYNEIKNWIELR